MTNKEKNFISAVIYVRNAESVIGEFLQKVSAFLEEYFEHAEIICVNDASTDDSISRIRRTAETFPSISATILHLSSFHGREAAMQGGTGIAIGDFVYEFDEPYESADAEDMLKIYRRALCGNDIVSAVSGKNRRASSGLFYRFINKSTSLSYELGTEYFRILSRRAINRIGSQNKIIAYRKVAYASCGLKMDSVVITNVPRVREEREGRRYRKWLAVDSLLMFTDVGFKFSLVMTVTMMVLMIAIAVYALVVRLMHGAIEGWASTVLLLTFGFFGIFSILSIITKYLQLLININVRKKAFTFENIEKLN